MNQPSIFCLIAQYLIKYGKQEAVLVFYVLRFIFFKHILVVKQTENGA